MALVANLNVWVLEYLLEQDKIGDAFIRHFYDGCLADFGELPPPVQVRLMLRVLRDGALNITENTVGSLDSLANLSQHEPAVFAPYSKIRDILPSREVYTAVRTEAFLKALRIESGSAEEQRLQLQRLFGNPETQTPEAERRQQLEEAIEDVTKRQAMFEKHPPQQAAHTVVVYVKSARLALGPPTLKLVEADFVGGRYNPYSAYLLQTHPFITQGGGMGSMAGDKRRRTADHGIAPGHLVQGTGHQGGLVGLDAPGSGRSILWDPQDPLLGTPDMALRNALMDGTGQLSPLQHLASPDGGLTSTGNRKAGAPRRKIGRWTEEETNALIRLTQEIGKSKWKKILEAGEGVFQNRSQSQQQPQQQQASQGHQQMGQPMMQGGMAMDRTAGVAGLEQRSSGQPEIGGPFEHSRPAHDGMDQGPRKRGRPRKNPLRQEMTDGGPMAVGNTVTGVPLDHADWAPHTQQHDPSQLQHHLVHSSMDLMAGLSPVGQSNQGHPGSALHAQLQHHDSHEHL
ncbi:hypothetical protein WJX84_008931 [Apatococcus fuscideae]|uniref:Myb-like domain-containing protein n=1 Tax=Apatococcus fuscideae TaxID=2026836 RepID=A0AAW1T5X0_9CHLO